MPRQFRQTDHWCPKNSYVLGPLHLTYRRNGGCVGELKQISIIFIKTIKFGLGVQNMLAYYIADVIFIFHD